MRHKSRKPKLSEAKIKELSALARKIDAEEREDIRARGRAVFKRHELLFRIVRDLKAERERRGLSLADIAHDTGIATPNLSRLENNRTTPPKIDTLSRYAQAVGKSIRVELVDV